MAIREGKALRLQTGDEVIIRADLFFISSIESPASKIAFNIVELADDKIGARVMAALPESSMPTLRAALTEAIKVFPNKREKLRLFVNQIKDRLFVRETDPLIRLRIKRNESRTIRADLVNVGTLKDTSEGRIMITITEGDKGNLLIIVPDRSLSRFASIALQAIRLARKTVKDEIEPKVELMTEAIIPDQMAILESNKDTPKGHTVVRMLIGGVPLEISAQTAAWKKLLSSLPK